MTVENQNQPNEHEKEQSDSDYHLALHVKSVADARHGCMTSCCRDDDVGHCTFEFMWSSDMERDGSPKKVVESTTTAAAKGMKS